MIPLVLSLMLSAQAVTQTPKPSLPPTTTPPVTTAPATTAAPPRRPAPSATGTATLNVRVTDRSGNPAHAAQVSAEGPSSRDGSTDITGVATLRTLPPGTYRVRAERIGFITLEKEVVVRTGSPLTVDFPLNAAPPVVEPPPPPPPPAPAPPPPPPPAAPVAKLTPGDPKVLSVVNLTEKSLSGRDPVKTVPIGCSGASKSLLLVVRESLQVNAHEDTDEMLYLVAGEAMLTLGDQREQTLSASWFGLVPRGTPYKIVQKGRNPAVFLTIVSGQPCE
jgi:mannose-6-phosphate isomerase-like protein (cupin superfamily)